MLSARLSSKIHLMMNAATPAEKEIILEAMRKAGEPLNAGKVAELTGLDRKVVDKAFAATMVSPSGFIISLIEHIK